MFKVLDSSGIKPDTYDREHSSSRVEINFANMKKKQQKSF